MYNYLFRISCIIIHRILSRTSDSITQRNVVIRFWPIRRSRWCIIAGKIGYNTPRRFFINNRRYERIRWWLKLEPTSWKAGRRLSNIVMTGLPKETEHPLFVRVSLPSAYEALSSSKTSFILFLKDERSVIFFSPYNSRGVRQTPSFVRKRRGKFDSD